MTREPKAAIHFRAGERKKASDKEVERENERKERERKERKGESSNFIKIRRGLPPSPHPGL